MNIDSFRKRLRYSLAFCFLCLGGALASAEPNLCPQIAFDFELTARDYVENYRESSLIELRHEVSRDLDSLCLLWFPFLEGISEEADSARDSLILVMGGREAGKNMPYQTIFLEFEAGVQGQHGILNDLGQMPLYKAYEIQPTQNPGELRRRINDTLAVKFWQPIFRESLMNFFLSKIPVADTLRAIPDDEQIAIPISCPHLRIAEESEFRANCYTLFGVSGDSPPKKADMRLTLWEKTDGELRCDVESFHCGPIKINGSPNWDDSIMTVFNRLVEGSLIVYLSKYNRDPYDNSDDNIVTDLEGDD